ncbi:MAG: alpha/beta hydrolase, partial [Phycisphaerales bacterium]
MPFNVAVIHGGPGAPGEMAPVARELASEWGVLEPFQTAASIKGQVEELKNVLEKEAELPVTLIGFSWGAWLGFIAAADYPSLVKKLILIGSGGYEEKYAAGIHQTRLSRLSEEERKEIETLIEILDNPAAEDKKEAFERLGELCSKADAYEPMMCESEII